MVILVLVIDNVDVSLLTNSRIMRIGDHENDDDDDDGDDDLQMEAK